MPSRNIIRYINASINPIYVLFLLSIVCSFRGISSITLGLIVIAGLIKNKIETGSFFYGDKRNLFMWGCFLFYIVQACGMFYTANAKEGLRHLEIKTALLVVPIAVYFNNYLEARFRYRLMAYYAGILLLAITYCLIIAFIRFQSNFGDTSVFFYHSLVSPFEQHAIQFSILLFIGIAYLLESGRNSKYFFKNHFIHLAVVVYFLLFLLLLSSKLVISFTSLYLVVFLIRSAMARPRNRVLVVSSVLLPLALFAAVLFTPNKISQRFNEIISGKVSVIKEQKFDPGDYFNGLQFRLLQWRFVSEILNEKNAWVAGLSPGDAKKALDEKYINSDMYIGDPTRNDHGYLGYNCHNQFLESILQSGLVGLLAYLLIIFGLILMVLKAKNIELTALAILLLAYSLTESILETQYGLLIFTFFPLFLYRTTDRRLINNSTN